MTKYLVTWTIDVEANTPEEAAEQALLIQRDPDSIATVFEVESEHDFTVIDLSDDEHEPNCPRGLDCHY